MIDVRMPDDDPIAGVDRVGGEARAGRAGDAVDVGVEEDREAGGAQAKGRAPVPVERGHAVFMAQHHPEIDPDDFESTS